MKKDKQVRSYTRKSKTGKVVTVRAHKATYDAADEQKKMASKEGSGNELSKKKSGMMENPLGFSKDEYKEWYHWDLDNDPNNESALKVEKALQKHMGKKAYNKYFDDMSDSYTKTGHTKAHKALMDDHAAKQKKQDAEIAKASKDIVAGAKQKAESAKASKGSDVLGKIKEHLDSIGWSKVDVKEEGGKIRVSGHYNNGREYKSGYIDPQDLQKELDKFTRPMPKVTRKTKDAYANKTDENGIKFYSKDTFDSEKDYQKAVKLGDKSYSKAIKNFEKDMDTKYGKGNWKKTDELLDEVKNRPIKSPKKSTKESAESKSVSKAKKSKLSRTDPDDIAKRAYFKNDSWFSKNKWKKTETSKGYTWTHPEGSVSVDVKVSPSGSYTYGVPKIKKSKK